MYRLYKKIRDSWLYSILFGCLLLLIFLLLFYLANLDLKPSPARPAVEASAPVNLAAEIQKKLGSSEILDQSYGEWAAANGLSVTQNSLDADPDGDGLPNYLEFVHGTDPKVADTDGDGFSDLQEIKNGYDPDAPGDAKPQVEISIKKIGVAAPMVWSLSESDQNMLSELENGVAHFYHTAAPGQNGNSIISGHSSNYVWAKGDYNYIFKDLGNLATGDRIDIKLTQKNGKEFLYHYLVTEKKIVSPDDPQIFEDTPGPTLTLATCWPLGTNFRRLVVKAEMAK